MTRRRRIAVGLAVTLIVLAALTVGLSALVDFSLSPQESLDPHHHGFETAAGFAAVLGGVALWRLREAARGRAGWADAGLWFGLAVLSLLALVAVGVASRLGG